MKWKIILYIKHLFRLFILCSLFSCSDVEKDDIDKTLVQTVPVARQFSQLETEIQTAIIDIEKKDIAVIGDSALKIDIEGLEVMRYSKKNYLLDELRSQNEDFKKYLNYLDKVVKNNKVLNSPSKREESQAKHDAVVSYLEKAISKASDKEEMYKVVYYLRAVTQKTNYTQPKTTYLDSSMKKISGDYGFLNVR